jgi:hypothetical protein
MSIQTPWLEIDLRSLSKLTKPYYEIEDLVKILMEMYCVKHYLVIKHDMESAILDLQWDEKLINNPFLGVEFHDSYELESNFFSPGYHHSRICMEYTEEDKEKQILMYNIIDKIRNNVRKTARMKHENGEVFDFVRDFDEVLRESLKYFSNVGVVKIYNDIQTAWVVFLTTQ